MSISGLRKTGEKYAKRYARLTMLSIAVAAVATAVIGAAGSPARLSVAPGRLSIPPTVAVFLQAFGLCFGLGLLGRVVVRNIGKLRELFAEWIGNPLRDRWRRLARRTQAVLFGLCCVLVAGGLAGVGVLYYNFRPAVVVVVMVAVWPFSTYWLLGRRPAAASLAESEPTTVRTRYGALRHVETRTIAALFGFLLAAAIAGGLWLLGVTVRATVGLGALVWLVATVVVYNRYASVLESRSDLTILETESNDDLVELVVRNDGVESVDLTDATITDTRTKRYYITESLQLSPATKATLSVPASFAVSPTDAERTLPLGYTLNRSQPTPVVYTQSGVAFELTGEPIAEDEPFDQPASSPASSALTAGTHSQES